MNKKGFLYKVFDLYYDGFRSMTLGKTLWLVILVKLFIMFFILKLFFFPNGNVETELTLSAWNI